MKFYLVVCLSILATCEGFPGTVIPFAIPVKRSYEQESAYQLPSPHADQLHHALRTVKARSQPENTGKNNQPVDLLWVPIPKNGKQNKNPLLPIPISKEMSDSKSPFKIVIVNSDARDKGYGSSEGLSIDGIERLLQQLEPTTQNVGHLPVQQHHVQIQHVKSEEQKFTGQLPPEPFRENALKFRGSYGGHGGDVKKENSYSKAQTSFSKHTEHKQTAVYPAKEVQTSGYDRQNAASGYKERGNKHNNADYSNQKDTSGYEEQQKSNQYSEKHQKEQSNVGYSNQMEQAGRSYGGKAVTKQNGAGSYVHVEVNSYGGPAHLRTEGHSEAPKKYGSKETAKGQRYGVSGVRFEQSDGSYGKPKPFGKAEVHVTVMGGDDHHQDDEKGSQYVQSSTYAPMILYDGPSEAPNYEYDGGYQSSPPSVTFEGYSGPEDNVHFDDPIRKLVPILPAITQTIQSYSHQEHSQTVHEGSDYGSSSPFPPAHVVESSSAHYGSPSLQETDNYAHSGFEQQQEQSSLPDSGYGQSQTSSGYDHTQSSSGYGQSQSNSGYDHSQSSFDYKEEAPSTSGYGHSQSNFGYGHSVEAMSGYGHTHSGHEESQSQTTSGYGHSHSGHDESKSNSGYGHSHSGHSESQSNSGYGHSQSGHSESQSNSGYEPLQSGHGKSQSNSGYGHPQSSHDESKSNSGYGHSHSGHDESQSNSGYGHSHSGHDKSQSNSGYGHSQSAHDESKSNSGYGHSHSGHGESQSNSGYGHSQSAHDESKSNSGYGHSHSGHSESQPNSGYGHTHSGHEESQSQTTSGYGHSQSGHDESKSNSGYGHSQSGHDESKSNSGYRHSHSGHSESHQSNSGYKHSQSGHGESQSNSGYRPSQSGHGQSQSNSGHYSKPSRPAYPNEEQVENSQKLPCKHTDNVYVARPPISVPEMIPESLRPVSAAFDKYQGGVQVAPPPVYPRPVESGPSYRITETQQNYGDGLELAANTVQETFAENKSNGKPFYIVIFQKRKVAKPSY
uniref:Filaggrin-2-like n=1 Tax=Strigamia maritima TaxID=126957 RepID=T1IKN3_STRMM